MRKFMAFLAGAACVALLLAGGGWASADDYVLTADQWGGAQTAAVTAAGGSVKWAHGETGVGVAVSWNPAFLTKVRASGVFAFAGKDMVARWQPRVRTAGLEQAAVTPGDETFINLQWNIDAINARGAWAAGYTGRGRPSRGPGRRASTAATTTWTANLDVEASRSFVPGKDWDTTTPRPRSGTGPTWPGSSPPRTTGSGRSAWRPRPTIIGVKVLDERQRRLQLGDRGDPLRGDADGQRRGRGRHHQHEPGRHLRPGRRQHGRGTADRGPQQGRQLRGPEHARRGRGRQRRPRPRPQPGASSPYPPSPAAGSPSRRRDRWASPWAGRTVPPTSAARPPTRTTATRSYGWPRPAGTSCSPATRSAPLPRVPAVL